MTEENAPSGAERAGAPVILPPLRHFRLSGMPRWIVRFTLAYSLIAGLL